MKIRSPQPTTRGGSDKFTGEVWHDVIARGEGPSRVRVNVVRFAPGARTAWHAHPVGQTLRILEGVARVQARGEQAVDLQPGDTLVAPPGEWHWHGAAPDHFMSHLAIWEAPETGPESEWAEHVSDTDYLADPAKDR